MNEYDRYEKRSLLFPKWECETCGELQLDQGLVSMRDMITYHKPFCGQKKEESE